jgi:hypothetical protein
MEKFVKGLIGFVGATIAWYLAAPAAQVAAVFASIVGLAIGVYIANRLFLHLFG